MMTDVVGASSNHVGEPAVVAGDQIKSETATVSTTSTTTSANATVSTTTTTTTTSATIQPNQFAIVHKIGGTYPRAVKLIGRNQILIEKLKFMPDKAFGQPFGTLFDVKKGGHLEVIVPDPTAIDAAATADSNGCAPSSKMVGDTSEVKKPVPSEDPSDLEPDSKRQKLNEGDVLALKETGASAKEIIDKLVAGNAQFSERTEYAQEKYVRRKTKKHGDQVLVLRPTIRLVCESYYHKEAEKVAFLRPDLLSEVLSRANVIRGANVVVVEQTQDLSLVTLQTKKMFSKKSISDCQGGLLTAGVIHRLAGLGTCIHIHQHDQAQAIPCLQACQFDEEYMSTFTPLPVNVMQHKLPDDGSCPVLYVPPELKEIPEGTDWSNTKLRLSDEIIAERRAKRLHRFERFTKCASLMNTKQIDSLVLASRNLDLVPLLERLLPSVRASSPVVLYSVDLQPLIVAQEYLRSQSVIDVRVSNNFFRKHQVLPGRTHPEMVQQVSGGFLLTGMVVL